MIRLAVMRPKDKMDESIQMAKELGFDPVPASPLQIVTNESGEFNQFIDELERGKVDMAVLTSSTGVSSLMQLVDRRMEREELLRYLKDVTMIAIGPLTAQAMEREGMVVSLIPEVFSSAEKGGFTINSISIRKPSLEDVFLKYTGKTIRESEATQIEQMKTRRRWR